MTDRTVACVFVPSETYTADWVYALQAQVAENLGAHRFVCLTNEAVAGVECVPLVNDWPGWWNKIELFRPGLLTGPTLYLDLDVLVIGRLEPLFRDGPGFSAVQDFLLPKTINSSAMAWEGRFGSIYASFERMSDQMMRHYAPGERHGLGDQAFILDHLTAAGQQIDRFPQGQVVSFKRQARHTPPHGARVVAFHGKPKMPDAPGWAAQRWEDLQLTINQTEE